MNRYVEWLRSSKYRPELDWRSSIPTAKSVNIGSNFFCANADV